MSTVRDLIKAIQLEVREAGDLLPDRAVELLNRLTSLLGNINDEIREADAYYAVVLLSFLETDEAANRAKIRAETTAEYQRKREARDAKELTLEMIRSLKYYLRSKQEEMRLSR